jgi:hypothetical protein
MFIKLNFSILVWRLLIVKNPSALKKNHRVSVILEKHSKNKVFSINKRLVFLCNNIPTLSNPDSDVGVIFKIFHKNEVLSFDLLSNLQGVRYNDTALNKPSWDQGPAVTMERKQP